MNENQYQAELIKRIKFLIPGCFVLKQDPNYIQGIPDLLVLYGENWAALEVKRSAKEPYRPNQEYYLGEMDLMSFAKTIYPENENEVLNDLQRSLLS